jgi:hypothetical protein
MDTARSPNKNLKAPTAQPTMGTPLVFLRVGTPEVRPDGSTVERFQAGEKAIREWLHAPPDDAARLLMGVPSKGWAGVRQPTKEREIHTEYRTLTVRNGLVSTLWRQDRTGTIVETALTVNPVFGAPPRRLIQPMVDGQPNPEWTRLDTLLSTPL